MKDTTVQVKLGPYGDQCVRVQTESAGDPPIVHDLIVMNMSGRPAVLTEVEEGICGDCNEAATYRVLELDGKTWLWCGFCDLGG